MKGRPSPTTKALLVRPEEDRATTKWGQGIAGISESFFPHPERWRLEGIDKPLDLITVKDLTRALTRQFSEPPTCFTSWPKRFEHIDLRGISERYSVGIVTPVDFGSHYKLVMHNSLLTNPHNPEAISPMCRLCGRCRESLTHFGECIKIKPIFEWLRHIDGGVRWNDQLLNLMGQHHSITRVLSPLPVEASPSSGIIPPGISLVHFCTWKFILIHLTLASLNGQPFMTDTILSQIRRRIRRKIDSAREGLRIEVVRAEARGIEPKAHKYHKWIKGIGTIVNNRALKLHPEVEIHLSD